MTLRTQSAFRGTHAATLGLVMLLLSHAPGSAQTLTPSANPSSGAPGVNSSYVTGSGFPAGAITDATLAFGAACTTPALTTTPATRVTAIGSLRRFQFLIPASLAPGSYKVWVSGKAGATPFSSVDKPSCSTITVTGSVQGTASLGAAISSGIVTLVDSTGAVRNGVTATDGTYKLDTTGLVPPYLVKVVTVADSGDFPAGTALYSVSADAGVSSRINVTVLSDLIMRSYYAALGLDPNAAFANPVGDPAPTPVAVASMAGLLLPAVQKWLDDEGVNATNGVAGAGETNVISSPLVAYQPGAEPFGLDAILHKITSETLNPDGSVATVVIAEGTVREAINPTFTDGLATFTFATTDSATGAGTGGALSGLVLDPALSTLLDDFNTMFSAFKDTVNTKGPALTANDLLPFYSADFLDDGHTAVQDATKAAGDFASGGVNLITLKAVGVKSLVNDVAELIFKFTASVGGEIDSETGPLFFRKEAGVWKEYGNQRIASVIAQVESRTQQGQGGFSTATDVFAGSEPVQGLVTAATVTGPANNPSAMIWNGASSTTIPKRSPELKDDGVVHDEFALISQPLGGTFNAVNAIVPVGSTFTIALTTNGQGNPQYEVESNAISVNPIQFTPLPAHVGLLAVVNKTRLFQFTLPTTFAYSTLQVHLNANIGSAVATDPTCNVQGQVLKVDRVAGLAQGSITFPADMTPCGLSGVAISRITIFAEVDGTLGETSLATLFLPY